MEPPVAITAVPYCVWDNRAPGEMRVWLRMAAKYSAVPFALCAVGTGWCGLRISSAAPGRERCERLTCDKTSLSQCILRVFGT